MKKNVVGQKYNLLIDCDTGVDDAYALLLACRCDLFNLVGVTTVAGNVDVHKVTNNTCVVLDAANAPKRLPVCKGFSTALLEAPHFCPEIHGTNGLGDIDTSEIGIETPSKRKLNSELHAVEFMIDQAKLHAQRFESAVSKLSESDADVEDKMEALSAEHQLTIVALAPMTNIAVALKHYPQLGNGVRQIVFMGGAARSGGNATPWAEANILCDPEAARIVLNSGIDLIMYPWDVFEAFRFTRLTVQPFLDEQRSTAAKLAGQLMMSEMNRFEQDFAAMGDAGTLCVLLRPDACQMRRVHVDVELRGELTRGMTVVDWRERVYPPDLPAKRPNVTLVTQIDNKRFCKLFKKYVCK